MYGALHETLFLFSFFLCFFIFTFSSSYAAYRVSFRSPDGEDGKDGLEIGSASFSIATGIRDGTPS